MPLKLKYVGRLAADFEIAENDRGEWEPASEAVRTEFSGFHGENTIHVLTMSMQSGIHDVVVIHAAVDSYIRVAHRSGRRLEVIVNALIEQVYSCDVEDPHPILDAVGTRKIILAHEKGRR